MSMNILADVTFESVRGRRYNIRITKRGYVGEVYNITPAADPFTTEENTSDDPLEPVRGSTGYFRFIYDGGMNADGEPWFVDFMPQYATEIMLVMRADNIDGEILWSGFAKPAQYSQRYDMEVREIAVPVVSALELIKTVEMDAENMQQPASWRELLEEGLNKVGVRFESVVVPYEWGRYEFDTENVTPGVKDINFCAPLVSKASRWAWADLTDAKNSDDPDWREIESKTYGEIMADWCRFWGWTLREVGTTLYLTSRRVRTYCRVDWNSFVNDAPLEVEAPTSENIIRAATVELSDDDLDGTGHTLEILPGVRSVEIAADTQEMEQEVLRVSAEEMRFVGREFAVFNPHWNNVERDWYWNASIIAFEPDLAKIELWARDDAWHPWRMVEGDDWSRFVNAPTIDMTNLGRRAVAGYCKIDFFARKEEAEKKNFSYKEGVLLYNNIDYSKSDTQYYKDEWKYPYTQPVVRLTGRKAVALERGSGWLAVNMRMSTINIGYDLNLSKTWNVTVKVGNKVWTGERWSEQMTHTVTRPGTEETAVVPWSVPVTFDLSDYPGPDSLNWRFMTFPTIDDKTLQMDCNGAAGYLIPVDVDLVGKVEITIYTLEKRNHKYILLEDVGVDFFAATNFENVDKKTVNRYYAQTGAQAGDAKKVALKLATDNDNNPGYGLIRYGANVADGQTYRTAEVEGEETKLARPEEVLLTVAREAYGRRMKLEMETKLENREKPTDTVRRAEWGATLHPVAERIDWADDRRTITLLG